MTLILNLSRRGLLAILLVFMCVPGWSQEQAQPQKPVMVAGGGGTKIAVYEYGNPAGPAVLFVHGVSQSHLSWARQYKSPALQNLRMIVIDLRGHGASEKPSNAKSYTNSKMWANDINAVIKAKNLRKPAIVGWSYGGYVITDYVREYGVGSLGGVVFVDAGTQAGTEAAKAHFGAGSKPLGGMLDSRQEINIPATAEFIKNCTVKPLSADDFLETFAYNMAVSPEVRLAMMSRRTDGNDALAKITVPVLVVQGEKDTVVLPAGSDYIAERVKHARKSYYPNAAHMPFFEDPERFNRELAEMASK